ncbi:GBS Bsp-like repeat-containing protein [Streptococcus loxodontisalivarius]|uniref:SH3b domain-containing protein n=1 Tax=Streptococcus loxodontisalivarius TaxID=1349415 RepID=A0ABS2PUF8_9STRE|nr:GBS Bsp-like repeat-containing protein [Streptococcus loxodontisalivarius]MBM7643170.1 hypothetical protein [Streptococcus loxodontisalivarius]
MKKTVFNHQEQRYSIRKYSFGAASVLLGTVLFMTGNPVFADQDITPTAVTSEVQVTSEQSEIQNLTEDSTQAEAKEVSDVPIENESQVEVSQSETQVTNSTDVAHPDVSSQVTETSEETPRAIVAETSQSEVSTETSQTNASDSSTVYENPEVTLAPSGQYIFTERTAVRNQPSFDAQTKFYIEKNQKVFYDQVLVSEGYQWVSYESYGGTRRYAAVEKLVTSPVKTQTYKAEEKVTGTLTIDNSTAQGFTVTVSDVYSPNGVKEVRVPVWTNKADQDDIIWYTAEKQANGSYKALVDIKDHKNELGDYTVHLYYVQNDGSLVGVASTQTSLKEVSQATSGQLEFSNQSETGFNITITNVQDPEGVKEVRVPVWTSNADQDDIVWYTAAKQDNGDYTVRVDTKDHKNELGDYNVHLYYVTTSGNLKGVTTGQLALQKETKTEQVTGKLTVSNQTEKGFDVTISDVKDPAGIKEVRLPVWTSNADQDDIIWYTAAKQANGDYTLHVDTKDHKNELGDYNIHLYYLENDGNLRGVATSQTVLKKAEVAPVTGTISFANQTETGFDIIVSGISDANGVAEVKLPVWTEKGDQDDLIWYTAQNQGNGTYKASLAFKNHNNEKGDYNVHLYYVENSGNMVGVSTAKFTAGPEKTSQQEPAKQETTSGKYVLTADTAVKNEAKLTAEDQFVLKKGSEINYDKLVEADGYQWLSYTSYSGTRRYLPFTKLTNSTVTVPQKDAVSSSDSKKLAASGTYQFTKTVEVKSQAKLSAETEFTFQAGEKIFYDQTLQADGHQWISYKSYAGIRRYIAID